MATFSHRIEYAGFALARALFSRLSLDRGASLAALMTRPLVPLLRKRATRNLRLAMPDLSETEYRRIVAGMADHLTRTAIEYLHLQELRDTPDQLVVEGIEHIERARDDGRGAVLITGHFGNWEAVRAACARVGYTPAIIYREFNNPLVDAECQRYLKTLDAPIFHKGRRGTLGMLRHIRKGGAVMVLSDQRFTGAPYIPFFDIPAKTALAPAQIALDYGAAFLTVHGTRRDRRSMFDVIIDAPLDTAQPGLAAADLMLVANQRLEEWVRQAPEQYFWLHNRWGKKPKARLST